MFLWRYENRFIIHASDVKPATYLAAYLVLVCLWNITSNKMSRRHAEIWSHPGHYLVDPYTWSRSPNGHGYGHEWPSLVPLFNVNGPSHCDIQSSIVQVMCVVKRKFVSWQSAHCYLRYSIFNMWPSKNSRSRLWPIRPIYLIFLSWQLNQFCWDITNFTFDLENSRSRSWPI